MNFAKFLRTPLVAASTHCSGVSIVDFEQVNTVWDGDSRHEASGLHLVR